jgi:2-polyprenyl-3-methyl-5-hydroxy-6-metoxy-1,4-benzoquinol methylase
MHSPSSIRSRIRDLVRRYSRRGYPRDVDHLRRDEIYTRWWYYNIELLPGVITNGQYERDFPMLPRLLLRNCAIEGMDCLDIGTMEGLIPTLMARRGARTVLATDSISHCVEKLAAVQHYHQVNFAYRDVGLMYDLDKKLPGQSFDLINCSGLLYHVVSPMHVLAGLRSLLRRDALLIVSTNVVYTDKYLMEFNDAGRLQDETNTFWYVSVPMLDYMLRYLKLALMDCIHLPHRNIRSHIRYLANTESGYLSLVCKAVDAPLATSDDRWMRSSVDQSWESLGLVDWKRAESNRRSEITYNQTAPRVVRGDTGSLDLWRAVQEDPPMAMTTVESDTHTLRLADVT